MNYWTARLENMTIEQLQDLQVVAETEFRNETVKEIQDVIDLKVELEEVVG